MKRFFTLALAVLAMGTLTQAQAEQSILASFGNTLKVEVNDQTTLYYFNEDGTFSLDDGRSGIWEIEGDDVCTYIDGEVLSCGPVQEGRDVGDTWQTTAEDGTVTTLTLIEGRE